MLRFNLLLISSLLQIETISATTTWAGESCFDADNQEMLCEPYQHQYHVPAIPDHFDWFLYPNGTLDFDTEEAFFAMTMYEDSMEDY